MTQGEQGAVNEPGEYFRLGNRSQPRQRRFAFFEEPRYAVAVAGIMVLGIVLRIAATWPMSMHHPDEVIQYLEQAHRLVFGYGVIPWEYRYRSAERRVGTECDSTCRFRCAPHH